MTRAMVREIDASRSRTRVKAWLMLSAGFLVVQVLMTDYGDAAGQIGPLASWFVVGVALLALVYWRRSTVARGVVVILSLTGAVIYAFSMFQEPRAAALVVSYLGQAVPLLTPAIRGHVRSED